MSEKKPNSCIKCDVTSCKNHCNSENFCSLSCVKIGTKESNPSGCRNVDCESFVAKG